MTRMIPDQVDGRATPSEKEVFALIRNAKGTNEYVCLHSLGIARHQRKEYAEADFVLVGPPGVFCLEVKGGHVDRKNGIWEIGWPGKSYQSVEGPFKQAESARWALLDYLKTRLGDTSRKELLFGWGVVFPSIAFTQQDPEWDNDVVYDQRDKPNSFLNYIVRLEQYFRRRLAATGKAQPSQLKRWKVLDIINCLRGDFVFVQSFKGLLADSERELITLSSEQYKILDLALNDENRRLMCNGGAGTGKTVIAMEAARRIAAKGKKVLLLCFNNSLQYYLAAEARDFPSSVKVSTVHQMLGEIIRRGGFGQELSSAHATQSSEALFGETYERLFELGAEALIKEGGFPQFDVIIIDEAQDVLNAPIMNCLDIILDGGFAKGRWLLFFDTGLQSDVYGRMDDRVLGRLKSFSPTTVNLNDNFRNPEGVVTEMCNLTGAEKPICKRLLASNVDYRSYKDEKDQAKKLRALLLSLLSEGVAPRHITILSAKRIDESILTLFPPDVGKPIYVLGSETQDNSANSFTAATISSFKGLENDFVILVDLPNLSQMTPWTRSMFYVGMTRARTKLFALVDENFLSLRSAL